MTPPPPHPPRNAALRRAALAATVITAVGAWAPAQAVDIDWGAHRPARLAQRNPLDYFLDTLPSVWAAAVGRSPAAPCRMS